MIPTSSVSVFHVYFNTIESDLLIHFNTLFLTSKLTDVLLCTIQELWGMGSFFNTLCLLDGGLFRSVLGKAFIFLCQNNFCPHFYYLLFFFVYLMHTPMVLPVFNARNCLRGRSDNTALLHFLSYNCIAFK